jgi:hypothetical protein
VRWIEKRWPIDAYCPVRQGTAGRHGDGMRSIRGARCAQGCIGCKGMWGGAAAQAKLLAPASSATAPSAECIIKGNINRQGERIYHLPGQGSYAAINMHDPQKRWFCSEDEARVAGWRPAKR